jgi:AraC-like DNA-binding protein
MEPKVDTLKSYHAGAFQNDRSHSPIAFLSALSTPRPVEFHTMQIHHHFNLQLRGSLESQWYRGRRSIPHVIAPGHTSLNVASEPFRCMIAPTLNSVSLHVILPQSWMNLVRQQHEEQLGSRANRELHPVLGSWRPELQLPARQIAEILQLEEYPVRLQMEELLLGLAFRLWQAEHPKPPRATSEKLNSHVLIRILDYIHAHFSEDISLESLANVSGLSPFHFCRAFRYSVGVSPWQYLKDIRLAESRLNLLKSELSVTDIALQLGFSSTSHFSTAFRNAFGISPAQFRKASR